MLTLCIQSSSLSVKAAITYEGQTVSGIFMFNEQYEMISFTINCGFVLQKDEKGSEKSRQSLFESSENKTVNFTIIEITMFPGRTREQKTKIYEEITRERNVKLGIDATDIFIVINELPNENWGLAGKQRK